jgi:hypothetical protein
MTNPRKSARLHILHGTARHDRATRPAQDARPVRSARRCATVAAT